jgi:hypothetical protein
MPKSGHITTDFAQITAAFPAPIKDIPTLVDL